MTIEKAIEILSDILHYVKPGDPPDEHDAIGLGIEALRWVAEDRRINDYPHVPKLPGETTEANEAKQ